MEQLNQFTLAHRKAIADMFKADGSLREKALKQYNERRNSLEGDLLREYAEEHGAGKTIANLIKYRAEAAKCEEALRVIGLRLDKDGIDTHYGAPDSLETSIKENIEKRIGTRESINDKYDEAMQKVWLLSTPEEIQKVVESLNESVT
jgi:hypothetical protein